MQLEVRTTPSIHIVPSRSILRSNRDNSGGMVRNALPRSLLGLAMARQGFRRKSSQVRGRMRAAEAWEEAQKRPPPIVQAAKAKAQRSPTWLAEAAKDQAAAGDQGDSDVEVVPDSVPGASKANFSRIYAREDERSDQPFFLFVATEQCGSCAWPCFPWLGHSPVRTFIPGIM